MKTNSLPSVDKKKYLIGAVLALVGAILYSTKAVMVKLAYQYEVDSISLLALRMLFSLPFYLLIAYWTGRKSKTADRKLSPRQWIQICFFGIMGYYLASMLDFIGLQYVTAGLERLILFMYPTLVLILSAVFLGKKIQRIQYLAVLVTYIGIAITFVDNLRVGQDENFVFGSVLIFVCALAFAIYLIGSGKLLPYVGTWRYTSLSMAAATGAIALHHGLAYRWDLFHFQQEVYELALLMAVVATILPSFIVMESIRIIGASNGAIIGSVGPISTIILAEIFLGEHLTAVQWLGTFIVIGGVLMITLRKHKTKAQ